MIDWKRWLPGLPDDDTDDPVSKTLRSLQQGATDIGAGVTQGVQTLGTGLSSAAQTASSYLPDLNPAPNWTPEEQETEAEIERRRGIVRAGAAAAPAAAYEAGREAYEDPLTSTMPAPARAVAIGSRAGSAAGSELVGAMGEAAAGSNEPLFTTPEVPTPVGTVPAVPVTPRMVGGAVGSVLGDPTSYVLPGGAADRAADLALRNLAAPVARAAAAPVRAAGRAVGGLVDEAAEGLGAALGRNAERVAAADARMAAEGSTLAPAGLGALPGPGGARQTVEVLQDRLETATSAWQRARQAGDERMAALAREHAVAIESELADARNARLDLEPAITSDVGRRVESLPLAEETADTLAGAGSRRADVEDLGGPVSHVPSSINLNAGLGAVPGGGGPVVGRPAGPEGGRRVWVPDARYQSGGFWRTPEARVPDDLRAAQREVILRNADHLGAVRAREELEASLARAPDEVELQRELMSAVRREEEAKDVLDAAREWQQMVTTGDKTLATSGTLPAGQGAGALSAVNRALSEGIAGGVGGAVLEQGLNPDDPYAAPRGFVEGMVGFPAATRLARGAARLAGAAEGAEGGALAAFGTPGAGGAPQPGPGFFARFPGAQKAIAASQARAANMAARGITAPSAWDWLKQFGYSGIFSPATATGQLISGAVDVGLAQPKEAIRAAVTGKGGRYSAQARAQLQAVPEAWQGVLSIVGGQGGSAGAAARSGGAQGSANLSERVVNPVAHFAARALEYPGEVLAEAPDAVFRPLFNAQGMQREADTIANELGHKGQQKAATAAQLMQDAQTARATPGQAVSAEAQRIVDAGKAYADEMGYKGDPGRIADWIGQQAKRDDGIGLAASFLFPFSRTPGNIALATARSTPGIGLLPSVRQGRPITSFDTVYDQAFGTLAASGFAYYATQGGITGSGPTDKPERDAMIAKGWQPRSFLVPGGYYVPNRALGKWGAILDAIGEAHDVMAYTKPGGTGADYMTDAVKRISKIATDQVGLSGLADLADLADGVGSQLPGTIGRSVTRYVPFGGIIRAAALGADPTARKPEGWSAIEKGQTPPEQRGFWSGLSALRGAVGEQVAQNIPRLRGGVPEAQDVLGRPMPNAQYGAGVLVPKTTSVRDDPTVQAFQQAGVGISAPKTELTVDGIPVELTPEETRRWNTARGEVLIRVAPGMTGRDFWSKPAERQQAMQDVLRDANAAADAKILGSLGASEVQRRVREAGRRQRDALTQKAS